MAINLRYMANNLPAFRLLTLSLCLLLSACATTLKPDPNLDPDSTLTAQEIHRINAIQQRLQWQFEGRISVRIEENGNSDGGSGRLSWIQTAESLELDFYAALGRGAWHLWAESGQASVRIADGSEFVDTNVQSLLRQQLGWDVPVNSLSCWLRGLVTAPECAQNAALVIDRDSEGRPLSITEGEWQVQIQNYLQVDNFSLPQKVEFSAPGRKFKLVIKQWALSMNKSG